MSAIMLVVDDPIVGVVGVTSVFELIPLVDEVDSMEATVLLNNPGSMVPTQS